VVHWGWFIVGFIVFTGVALGLEATRTRWYGKWLGPVALGGVMLAGVLIGAMLQWSTDIPFDLAPMDFAWWVYRQHWYMFGVTALPILIADALFMDRRRTTDIDKLQAALDSALAEIRDLRNEREAQ